MIQTDDTDKALDSALAKLPEPLRRGVRLYLLHGIWPGEFLYAVLTNHLARAVAFADDTNSANLRDITINLWDMMPLDALGSEAKVQAWMAKGGTRGRTK